MRLLDFKEQIDQYEELEGESQARLLTAIRRYANTQKKRNFKLELKGAYEQVAFSGIEVIYEALSNEPKKWGSFFLEEYQRAFKKAETADNAFEILECLDEISFAELEKTPYEKQIIQLLASYLNFPKDAIQYKAIWNLGDWLTLENLERYSHIEEAILKKLKHKNWKIRFAAKMTLEDLEALPGYYNLSFWDRLKINYLNPYNL